jgi:triosephosphate isomerase
MRRPVVAGNWKMHGTRARAAALAADVARRLAGLAGVEVVLCPPFTALAAVAATLAGGALRLGGQDLHWEREGALTGEVSGEMLRDLGCTDVIVGHSERRTLFGETDASVARKVEAALTAGLRPIVCIGETFAEREGERTDAVLRAQVERGLGPIGPRLADVVVAYEPVWAIGTGRNATVAQAQAAHATIRRALTEIGGAEVASSVRVLYGGSVKPANAAELFGAPDVDGGLVGGAALDADAFASIVRAARPAGS